MVQQDNDLKHSAKATQECFEDNKVDSQEWSSQSPDRNTTENLTTLKKWLFTADSYAVCKRWNSAAGRREEN